MLKKLFPLLPVIFLSTCASFNSIVQEPQVSFNSVDIAGISFDGVNLIAHVDIENPNAFSIPMPKIDWELFINTASFVKGSLPSDTTIKSRQKVTLDLPVSVTYDGLYNSFKSLIETKEAAYKIALGISFPVPIIESKVYNLDFEGTIPMLRIPGISFQGIAKKSLGTTMEFVLNWEVENKNSFDFDIGEFNYDFSVNNSQWASGRVNNPPRVSAGGKTGIPLTVSISALSLVRDLVGIINSGSPVNYNCTGGMSLLGNFPGLEKLELPLNLEGNTRIR